MNTRGHGKRIDVVNVVRSPIMLPITAIMFLAAMAGHTARKGLPARLILTIPIRLIMV
jgi:hypothetical protein